MGFLAATNEKQILQLRLSGCKRLRSG